MMKNMMKACALNASTILRQAWKGTKNASANALRPTTNINQLGRFDALSNESKLKMKDIVNLPSPVKSTRGGARTGAGRKAQTTDGGPLRRCMVSLDKESIAILMALSGEGLSQGIRIAARQCQDRR